MRILILVLVLCSACKMKCEHLPGYSEFMEECSTRLPYDDCWWNANRLGKVVCE